MRETIDRTINTVNGIYVIPAIVKPIASGSWVPVTHIGIIDDKGKATCLCGQALVDEREGTHSEYNNVVYDPDNGIVEIECQKCIRALAWMKKTNNFDSSDALVRHLSHVLGEKAENRQYHTPREVSPSEASNTTSQEQEPVERRGILIIEKPVEKIVEVEVEKIVEVEKVVEVEKPITNNAIMNYVLNLKHIPRAKLIADLLYTLKEPCGTTTEILEILREYGEVREMANRIGGSKDSTGKFFTYKTAYFVMMLAQNTATKENQWIQAPGTKPLASPTMAIATKNMLLEEAKCNPESPVYGYNEFKVIERMEQPFGSVTADYEYADAY